jgi:hypothetical protein
VSSPLAVPYCLNSQQHLLIAYSGFETGNELGGYMLGGGAPPASWTKNIAAHIKSLAPSTLILDGTDGLTTYGGDLGNTGVGLSSVDLVYVFASFDLSSPVAPAQRLKNGSFSPDRLE